MSALENLQRAELLKLRTTPATWMLLAAMAIVTLVVTALTAGQDAADLRGAEGVREVLTVGGATGYVFAFVLGIVAMSDEYRHGTLGHALLAAPARWQVLLAKATACAAAGLVFGVVALAVTFAIGVPSLAGKDAGVDYGGASVRNVVFGTLLAHALFAAIGAGLAALLRDSRVALAVGLGWVLLVESLAIGLVPSLGRFMPSGTVASMLRLDNDEVLAPGLAALVLLGYALVLPGAGALLLRRRDVT